MRKVMLAGVILCAAWVAANEPLFEKVLFAQGDNGYNTYRIPALYETKSGVLLAFAEGRRNSFHDRGDIDTVLRRSMDQGRTWSPMQVVWSDGLNTCGNPTVVQDRITGRTWLFMTHNYGEDSQAAISDGTSRGVRTIWSCFSDDDGATWSRAVNRFHEVQPADVRWDATGPGRGIQMRNGPHAGRLIIPANGRNIYSDDHGETWKQSTWLERGSSESQIVELCNGVLLRNDRRVGSTAGRAFSVSEDGGESWSGITYREDLPCPRCMGSTIAIEDTRGECDTLLLFSNPSMDQGDFRRRYRMTVQGSFDLGQTWPLRKLIYPSASAYSCLSPIGKTHIGLLYENGESSMSAPQLYQRITFARFSRDWLEQTNLFLWDFEDAGSGARVSLQDGAVPDVKGFGLNGTAEEAFEIVPCTVHVQTRAVRMTGNGTGIFMTDEQSRHLVNFAAEDDFTIRVVFRTTAHTHGGPAGSGALLARDLAANTKSWWLRVQDGTPRFHLCDGPNAVSIAGNSRVTDGGWNELVVVRNATERKIRMYLNGRLDAEIMDRTEEDIFNSQAIIAGRFNNGRSSFIGDLALVALYRSDLSSELALSDVERENVRDIRSFIGFGTDSGM